MAQTVIHGSIDEQSATHEQIALRTASTVGRPAEQLDIQEPNEEDNIVYPTGPKLFSAMAAIVAAMFLIGLDLTIVAVTIPSLTNEFNTIEDIGWYSSSYGVFLAAFGFLFGKLYTIYSPKWLFVSSFAVFEFGSLLCTVAHNSPTFILGRSVAGIGSTGIGSGAITIIAQSFPVHKRPLMISLAAGAQSVGLISSPPIGGALIDSLSWRACFGINLPFGVLVIILTAWGYQELNPSSSSQSLTRKQKLQQIDYFGTLLVIPAVCLLLIGLQWGGIRYGWRDPRIVVLFVLFVVLFTGFGWWQVHQKEDASIPPRILKNRSVIAASWFSACCNGVLAVTEYYMSIYFQGVKGYSATKSGLMILPMIFALMLTGIASGVMTPKVGYVAPFMIATTILAPIATGLVTTVDIDENLVKVLCFLGFVGAAVGIGIQAPLNAINAVLPTKDIPIGCAVTGFGGGMGSALFIAASAALFQNRLEVEIAQAAPGTNTTTLQHAGLSGLRTVVGEERLKDVLLGYDEAVTQTLYVPVALACATLVGSAFTEWKSLKKKQR